MANKKRFFTAYFTNKGGTIMVSFRKLLIGASIVAYRR